MREDMGSRRLATAIFVIPAEAGIQSLDSGPRFPPGWLIRHTGEAGRVETHRKLNFRGLRTITQSKIIEWERFYEADFFEAPNLPSFHTAWKAGIQWMIGEPLGPGFRRDDRHAGM